VTETEKKKKNEIKEQRTKGKTKVYRRIPE